MNGPLLLALRFGEVHWSLSELVMLRLVCGKNGSGLFMTPTHTPRENGAFFRPWSWNSLPENHSLLPLPQLEFQAAVQLSLRSGTQHCGYDQSMLEPLDAT